MQIQPYILIGGDSTRFGRDKATFEFEGETLASRAVRICEAAFPDSQITFVSKAAGTFLGRRTIGDVYARRGATGAIHAALADASTDWIFVLACDLPMATSDLIRTLSNRIGDEYGCVVPVQPDGPWQPLCAFYNTDKCLEIFEKVAAADGRHVSLRTMIGTVAPRVVEFSEYASLPNSERLLTNVNSMADLESI